MRDQRAVTAARLKEAREYLGLSQQDVADATKLPRSAISLIETGQRRVDTVELSALARLYQRPITYFTGDEDEKLPDDVSMLARQASKLSEKDRSELMRFTEFLVQRSKLGSRNDKKS
jgi:transcriptional regulator with XRE-family HTH domain